MQIAGIGIMVVCFLSLQAGTTQEWKSLIEGIETADLAVVKNIVPSRIKIDEKTKGGKSLINIAEFLLNKRKSIIDYLTIIKEKQASTQATKTDWDSLIQALNSSDLAAIKTLVPLKMAATSKTRAGREVLQIAHYHYDRQKSISDYLVGLAGKPSLESSISRVEFYNKNEPYYEFTNFYPAPIKLDGKIWPTTEHYFQAGKFPHNQSLQEAIRATMSPRDAFNFARQHDKEKRPDWESVKDDIMRKALSAKFTQHAYLQQLLLATGNAQLVEASALDGYWGYGANKQGKNMLGKLLMELRNTLKNPTTADALSLNLSAAVEGLFDLHNSLRTLNR